MPPKVSGPHARAAAYFALLALLFFAPAWLTGRVYVPSDFLYRTPVWYNPGVKLQNFDLFDTTIFFYPDYDYLNKSLHRGHFPLWNPYNLGGRPVAFNGASGYFYPPRLLCHWLLPTVPAITVLLITHLFLAGFLMYLLASRLGQSFAAALLSGTAWMLNGWSVTWFTMEHAPIFSALLPLGLLALRQARQSWRATAAMALVVALTVVAGSLQLTYYVWALMILVGAHFVFSQPRKTWLPATTRIGLGFVLGVLLAAPLLLPTVVNMTSSQRPTLTLDFLQTTYREALLGGIPTFVFPDAFGNPADDFALVRVPSGGYFIYAELCCYIGVASVLLFGCCLWQRGFPRYLAGMALVCLLVPATPLYGLVYWLPGLSRINSTRLVFLWMFFAALGSGYGLDGMGKTQKRWLLRVSVALMGLWLATLAYLQSGVPQRTVIDWLVQGKVRLPDSHLYLTKQEHLAAALRGFQATYGWTSWAALAPLLWLFLFCLALYHERYTRRAIPLLLAIDLLCFGVRFNSKMVPASIYPETPTIRFLKENTTLERVMGVGTVRPNSLMPFELNDACGYDAFFPLYSGRYFSYLINGEAGLQGPMSPQAFPVLDYRSRLVNLLGVRYFIAYPGQMLEGCRQVAEAPLPIFENSHPLPRAFTVANARVVPDLAQTLRQLASGEVDARQTVLLADDPGSGTEKDGKSGTAEIVSYQPHEVRLRLPSDSGGGWLVLTDAYAPGWSAEADGRPIPIFRADAMFRAVPLQGKVREVIFRYQPPYFPQGLGLSALGLVVSLGLLFLGGPGSKEPD